MKNNKIGLQALISEMILLTKKPNMKKTSIRLVLAFACSSLILGACKKDKDGGSTEATKENLVGTYKVVSAKAKVAGVEMDLLAQAEACDKDNHIVLTADFKAQFKDEGEKCDPPGDDESTWSLDGKYISIADEYYGEVKSFKDKQLVLETTVTEQGITATTTFVLQKL